MAHYRAHLRITLKEWSGFIVPKAEADHVADGDPPCEQDLHSAFREVGPPYDQVSAKPSEETA